MFPVSLLEVFIAASCFMKFSDAQDRSPTGPTQPNITKKCTAFHTIVKGDGCWSVEKKYEISHVDFIQWNPDVSEDCLTNFWLGSAYCVGVGAVPSASGSISSTESSFASSSSTGSPARSSNSGSSSRSSITSKVPSKISSSKISSATANATYSIRHPIVKWNVSSTTIESTFPPKKTQQGQSPFCINWHLVVAGETCQDIVGSATWATMEQFLEWNPEIGSDCSGLYDGWWVCIATQAQSMTVKFDYIVTPTAVQVPDPTAHTPTVFPSANSSFVASPTQTGLASNCKAFHQAKDGETCTQLPQYGLFSQEQFFSWNPALNAKCDGLLANYYYCVAAGDFLPAPPTTTNRPASVPQGQVTDCTSWYQADYSETCDEIVEMFGRFSKEDLIKWNPNVGSSCGNIVDEQYLCVGIPGTLTTRTLDVQSTTQSVTNSDTPQAGSD